MKTEGKPTLRRDARRNQERLLAAAAEAFREKGLAVPLEEIAQRAGVSAGTLYNRFGGREALIDAVMPELAAERMDEAMRRAEAVDDPWESFVTYVTVLCEQQADDPAFRDAISRQLQDAPELTARCTAELAKSVRLLERAQRSGTLRADVTSDDLMLLIFTNALIVRETVEATPDAWRRMLSFSLAGLRADCGSQDACEDLFPSGESHER
ncbi:TetR/AcrR family transcriptional regulator [Amycolatopsis sp. La24]|uniref:TetR/AcrR family transcriptional regulator n=1 Tax=Amycolatopsis sp. La24 TaxID=3028304 RepID=UPI0023B0B8B3|nr:TetR/AcrR family transcriptional regulator [Amycolatopsis sp. La24]